MNSRFLNLTAAVGFAAAAWTAAPQAAHACGGFFCNNAQPVNQAAESIIFSDNPDGTVTAVVQILYSGPAESFAWVLPVPTVPTVGISSNLAFNRLQNATNPTYQLNRIVEGECKSEDDDALANESGNNAEGNNANNSNGGGGRVSVLASGAVGPYNYDVIEVQGDPENPVDVAIDWLESNNYDVAALAPELLEEYLEAGMKFIAFKLTKNRDAGDIRPVVLNYEMESPMIPIKLTAVAANDDMGVLVWVLGENRAVPTNYRDLVLNETLVNWFNPGSNYNDVVNKAADEAGGQGFVTEMADSTDLLDGAVTPEFELQEWETLKADTAQTDQQWWQNVVWNAFPPAFDQNTFEDIPWDGFGEVIDVVFGTLTNAERARVEEEGPEVFNDGITFPTDFDRALAIQLIDQFVAEPMADTQKLIDDATYFTRMYTTMSAGDMTVDPVFQFNANLSSYSNSHTRDMIIECDPNIYQFEAPFRVEFDDGLVVRGAEQNVWPIVDAMDIPYNAQIRQQSTDGEPEVVEDNVSTIRSALTAHNRTVPTGQEMGAKAAGGCSTTPNSPASLWLVLVGFVAAVRRRKSSHRLK